jgi:hypothetical protein
MLVTHWGLSGPVILRLSAWGARDLFSSGYKGNIQFYSLSLSLSLSIPFFFNNLDSIWVQAHL